MRASIQPSKALCILEKAPRILPVRRSMLALVGRKQAVVRDQLSPQKPPGSRLWFSRTGVQYFPRSSTIELPSVLAESGAYPPDRALAGSPRQCSLPVACRHLPKGPKLELGRSAHLRTPSSTNDNTAAASPEGEPGPTPAGKTLPHS